MGALLILNLNPLTSLQGHPAHKKSGAALTGWTAMLVKVIDRQWFLFPKRPIFGNRPCSGSLWLPT
jgi:hypothetical protein